MGVLSPSTAAAAYSSALRVASTSPVSLFGLSQTQQQSAVVGKYLQPTPKNSRRFFFFAEMTEASP
jgi:hypothetical protein